MKLRPMTRADVPAFATVFREIVDAGETYAYPEDLPDNAIADQENETLNQLAEGLGIDEARANELLDGVEQDLAANEPEAPETD